jgi:anhydro-N-acetylmuramic acid kinase
MSNPDLFMGIMSGTSLDGIDVVIARFDLIVECIAHESFDFDPEVRYLLYQLATASQVGIDTFVRSHFLLGEIYSQAVTKTLERHSLDSSQIKAVGLHGQTIRHLPVKERTTPNTEPIRATFQLGSGAAVAALSGIDVVSDFRSADVAIGGQGAPLVPMFDAVFLRSADETRVALNIGGIANITSIPPTSSADAIIAYDTGPGNMIMDGLCQKYFSKPFDADGSIASRGRVNEALLSALQSHAYFKMPPPKSTGRELFGDEFLAIFFEAVDSRSLSPEDAIRTATELTARSIANELVGLRAEIIVNGGGAKNAFLMQRLKELLPSSAIVPSDAFGIPSQAKEALAFAYFAKAFLNNEKIHLPSTTGASRQLILGSLSKGK